MSKKISEEVYRKIKKEDVQMKPCGYFKARSSFWLIVSGLLFAVTILLVSLDIYYVVNLEPAEVIFRSPSLLLLALPYFLFALTIFLLYLTSRAYRRSRNMCQHEEWMLYTALIFGSFLIGLSVYAANMDSTFRKPMEKSVAYQKVVMTPKYFWSRPDKGTLSGVVLEKKQNGLMVMKSWNGKQWTVVVIDERKDSDKQVIYSRMVKMIGSKNGNDQFIADRVWQW